MGGWWRRQWQALRGGEPGRRFQDRYRRRRGEHAGLWRKLLLVPAALLVMVVGLVMMPAPGPGIVVFLFGAAVAAGELLWVARLMDHGELLVRRVWRRWRAR